jgi:hypothetical protein
VLLLGHPYLSSPTMRSAPVPNLAEAPNLALGAGILSLSLSGTAKPDMVESEKGCWVLQAAGKRSVAS